MKCYLERITEDRTTTPCQSPGRACHQSTFQLNLSDFLWDELGVVSVAELHETAQFEVKSGVV